MGYEAVARKLDQGKVVIMDGAVGSEVVRRTGRWIRNGIESTPQVIGAIHREYLAAGADVITANTFQIARHTFLNFFHGLDQMRVIGYPGLENRAAELAREAVAIALKAREEAGLQDRVAVAGSISPLNHPFRSDLAPDPDQAAKEHGETARNLAEAGVDLILLESMNNRSEAEAALRAAKETSLPVWVSLVPNGHGQTLGGEPLEEVAAALDRLEPGAILVNCAPSDHIGQAVDRLVKSTRRPVGAYSLIGRYAPPSWKMDFYPRFIDTEKMPPAGYADAADGWVRAGARIIGGCCGTTPRYIELLHSNLK